MTPDPGEIEQRVQALKALAQQQRDQVAAVAGHPLVANLNAGLQPPGRLGASAPGGVRDEVTMLAGFISDQIDADNRSWRLLYTDTAANAYLIINADDIVTIDDHADDTAPFGRIDYVWVRADARIGQGDNTTSLAGLLTAGGFTRAGDFRGSFSASAADSGTSGLGALCTARTPCCCNKRTS